jgi:hypothetical protein
METPLGVTPRAYREEIAVVELLGVGREFDVIGEFNHG